MVICKLTKELVIKCTCENCIFKLCKLNKKHNKQIIITSYK